MSIEPTILYECPTCHFKDDVADRLDVPVCPAGGEAMVAVQYVSLDAVVRFLFDDGKSVAAAKVQAEFGTSS